MIIILYSLFVFVCCFCFVTFVLLLFRSYRHSKRQPYSDSGANVRLAVIVGSGGHTAEMLRLVSSLMQSRPDRYAQRFYILADTDTTSLAHLRKVEERAASGKFAVRSIPRSREVRQSYVSAVFTTLTSFARTLPLINEVRPDVIMCNGPGTCIPVCVAAYLFDLYLCRTCRIIFVESVCRVERLSLTGKILYHLRLADVVFVQWPKMLERYAKALYLARF